MLLNLTEEQITQLAPDAASVKAGKGLANRTKWVLLEHSDRHLGTLPRKWKNALSNSS